MVTPSIVAANASGLLASMRLTILQTVAAGLIPSQARFAIGAELPPAKPRWKALCLGRCISIESAAIATAGLSPMFSQVSRAYRVANWPAVMLSMFPDGMMAAE